MEELAKQLMNVIIEGLEVSAAHFQRYVDNASGLLRWNHYPPCPQPHKALGMSAHTDFNLLTVLHQGDIGGLQVQKDGEWVAVRPHRGALAINIGDTLQVTTYRHCPSLVHVLESLSFFRMRLLPLSQSKRQSELNGFMEDDHKID